MISKSEEAEMNQAATNAELASLDHEYTVLVQSLQVAISDYKTQHETAQQQIAILDQNYHQQREQAIATLHMIAGAIAALEEIINTKQAT